MPPSRPHGGRGRAAPARAEVRKSGTRPDFLGVFKCGLLRQACPACFGFAEIRQEIAFHALHGTRKGTPLACLFRALCARIEWNLRSKFIKTGGVYLGFYTLRGRKFPHGNFRTSVFCEVKTHHVGKTLVFRQIRAFPYISGSNRYNMPVLSGECRELRADTSS